MESYSSAASNLKHFLLYLAFLYAILSFFNTQISHKLLIGHRPVRVEKTNPDLPYGTFKILQVADMHYGNGALTRCRDMLDSEFEHCSDLNTSSFLKRMIEAEKPDFIAFTELSLRQWVKASLPHNVLEVVDVGLLSIEEGRDINSTKNIILFIIEISLRCSEEVAEKRMDIREAVPKLMQIKLALENRKKCV